MKTYHVTGALDCIGAWVLSHLVKRGDKAISFDVSGASHRIDLLLATKEQTAITFVRGDLTDSVQVLNAFPKHNITHVLHLAAFQVPFCRANPVKGTQVIAVGTINVFEAAKQTDNAHIAHATSFVEQILPFPETFDDHHEFRSHFSNIYYTPLENGIQQTMDYFEKVKHDPHFEKVLTI